MWRRAVDAGCTKFDTANIYAQGDSERALGRLLRDVPSANLRVVTKAGFVHGRKADLVRLVKPILRPVLAFKTASETVHQLRSELDQQDFNPEYLQHCVRGSFRRLGVTSLWGFLLHDPSATVLSSPETRHFLLGLRDSGYFERCGVSLRDQTAMRTALDLGPIDMLQMSLETYEAMRRTDMAREIAERKICITVRQVLNRTNGERRPISEVLAPLLDDPLIESILIGISKEKNLDIILNEFTR